MISTRRHLEALRAADRKADERVAAERDRAVTMLAKVELRAAEIERENRAGKDNHLNNLRSTMATSDEVEAAIARIEAMVAPLTTDYAARQGGRGRTALIGAVVVGGFTIFGIIMTFLLGLVATAVTVVLYFNA